MIIVIMSFGETSAWPVPSAVRSFTNSDSTIWRGTEWHWGSFWGWVSRSDSFSVSGQGCHGRAPPLPSFSRMTFHAKGKGFEDL